MDFKDLVITEIQQLTKKNKKKIILISKVSILILSNTKIVFILNFLMND